MDWWRSSSENLLKTDTRTYPSLPIRIRQLSPQHFAFIGLPAVAVLPKENVVD